tara:strand:- start:106 stop:981 length:876 start_codon:yes stop_codon:yes gene_type:complete
LNIPVKNYRLRKLKKFLKKTLISEKFKVKSLAKKWQIQDIPEKNETNKGLSFYEASLFSQNGEDGIIRYIFSQIGFDSRYFVEFGFGAHQCNSLRLILHENFKGLMMDGSEEQCRIFNLTCKAKGISDVHAVNAFIDRDNLEHLIRSNNIPAEIDFLSIDVDGNDYWFWRCLQCINPRVICIEYNSGIGSKYSWTIPYNKEFERFSAHPSGFFAGASIKALESLGEKKGYRLVGCDTTGTNAFFLRNDLGNNQIPTLKASEAFRPHQNWIQRGISQDQQLEIMKLMPYIEV